MAGVLQPMTDGRGAHFLAFIAFIALLLFIGFASSSSSPFFAFIALRMALRIAFIAMALVEVGNVSAGSDLQNLDQRWPLTL